MNFSNPIVGDIKAKIDMLISERNQLQNSLTQLEARIMIFQEKIADKDKELEEVEQKMKVLKLAKSLDGEQTEGTKDLKLKINEMVREIDKCIALLNK